MRHVRTLTLCLFALCACTALLASTASAEKLPAWGKCEATESGTGGKFADAGCTVPVKKVNKSLPGGYEWFPLAESSALSYGEDAKLNYTNRAFEEGIFQPVSQTTITFADGHRITCEALRPETLVVLTGPHATTVAPHLAFKGCVDDAGGEECRTLDARIRGEITVSTSAWNNGAEKQEEPEYAEEYGPSWNGTMSFIEGKRSSSPKVAFVYKAQEKGEPFLQQLVCNESELHAVHVGGHRGGEQLVMPVEPVNRMSPSFTTRFEQSGGVEQPASLEGKPVKPLEAEVNAERWEPIAFEATMLFPTELYVGFVNHNYKREELELKATP
jgi:hypothetical protein